MSIARWVRLAPLALLLLIAGCAGSERTDIAIGLLESDRVELRADAAEPVTQILVTEGQRVSRNDPLLQLDTRRIKAQLAEAQAASAETRARLAELVRGPRQEQIEAARASLEAAQTDQTLRTVELTRALDLRRRELAAPDELDRARAAYDSARAQVALATAQLEELLNGTTAEQLEQAQQRIAAADARIERLTLDLERLTLRAPADGIVDTVVFETGERPAPGQTLLVMLTGTQPYARVYVPESMRVALSPGIDAKIAIDGLESIVPGSVRQVASASNFTPYFALTRHDRGRLTYVAEVDLVYEGGRLPDGVPVEVSFGDSPAPDKSND